MSVFIDKQTGEQVRIINENNDFYVLDNSVSIKKDIFSKKYTESIEVDPNSFFQQQYSTTDPLANLANQIRGLDSSKVPDVDGGTKIKYTPPVVISDNSMSQTEVKQPQFEGAIQLSPEEKKRMLDEWKRTQPGAQIPEVQERNWDDLEDMRFLNGDKPVAITPKVEAPKVDPIQMMFKMFKNNYPVKINFEIEENIPNPQFIGMVQENVEADAVEYYANLISEKILKDPSNLKSEVYKQLKLIINNELGIEEKNNE